MLVGLCVKACQCWSVCVLSVHVLVGLCVKACQCWFVCVMKVMKKFQKRVPEPSSSGAAYFLYSEVSIYPKVAAMAVSSVYLSIDFTTKNIHMF